LSFRIRAPSFRRLAQNPLIAQLLAQLCAVIITAHVLQFRELTKAGPKPFIITIFTLFIIIIITITIIIIMCLRERASARAHERTSARAHERTSARARAHERTSARTR